MEEEDQSVVDSDDSQAPSQDQEEDTAPAYLVRDAGTPPLRAVGMMKAMQLVGGDDYIQAALDADKRLGTDRVRLEVYSERTGGTARKERLEQKAADITLLHVKHLLIALREPHPSRTLPCTSPHLPT